jgi:hypothetical protein
MFASGVALIAFVYAVGIHLFMGKAPFVASFSAVLGAFIFSFFIWRGFFEKKGVKHVSGILLGAFSGYSILLFGPMGFYWSKIFSDFQIHSFFFDFFGAILLSATSSPLVFLVMHGWSVVVASVMLGAFIENLAQQA